MLDNDDRVADVAQILQRFNQLVIVALVQTDGRFIEDIKHAHQRGTDLGCQSDALCLAAGQRSRTARKGQIVKTDIDEKAETRADFLENFRGDLRFCFGQMQTVDKGKRFGDGLTAELVDVFSADGDCKHGGIQTLALAFRTRRVVDKLIVIIGFFPVHALRDLGDDAFPLHILALNTGVKGARDVIGLAACTPEQGIERRLGVVLDRCFQGETVFCTDRIENRT